MLLHAGLFVFACVCIVQVCGVTVYVRRTAGGPTVLTAAPVSTEALAPRRTARVCAPLATGAATAAAVSTHLHLYYIQEYVQ